ncbi:MAG: hypothetical protein DRZ82_01800 [Thermoprotei archaeon]|nr:MAG: hypothetical protein DRZ82_01800 [Thermoprotei archaeon]
MPSGIDYGKVRCIALLLSITLYVSNILAYVFYHHLITTIPPTQRIPPVMEVPIIYKVLFFLSIVGLVLLIVHFVGSDLGKIVMFYIVTYTLLGLARLIHKLINEVGAAIKAHGRIPIVGVLTISSLVYLTVLILSLIVLVKVKGVKGKVAPHIYIGTAIFCYLIAIAIRFPLTAGSYDPIIIGLVTSGILATITYVISSKKRDIKMIIILSAIAISAVLFLAYPVYIAYFGGVGIELGLDLLFILFTTYPLLILALFRMYQLEKHKVILLADCILVILLLVLIPTPFIRIPWTYCQFPIMPLSLTVVAYIILLHSIRIRK